eukprot:m.117587 g.117587  ORF g.117587 m.117587 type:complete len:111 (-) comp21703_c0_seq5:82-414(-)
MVFIEGPFRRQLRERRRDKRERWSIHDVPTAVSTIVRQMVIPRTQTGQCTDGDGQWVKTEYQCKTFILLYVIASMCASINSTGRKCRAESIIVALNGTVGKNLVWVSSGV